MTDHFLEELCRRADEFYDRGDAFGGSGNLSLRAGDIVYITPTGRALKDLHPSDLARVDLSGAVLNGKQPSKEYPFHLSVYRNRRGVEAVVHLHSPHAVAVSCLADLNEARPLPALTPYFVMRVAPLGIVEYHPPGSDALASAIGEKAKRFGCMLLRNHGLVCTGSTFGEAADRAMELEETCRLYLMLRHDRIRALTEDEIRVLEETFPGKNR